MVRETQFLSYLQLALSRLYNQNILYLPSHKIPICSSQLCQIYESAIMSHMTVTGWATVFHSILSSTNALYSFWNPSPSMEALNMSRELSDLIGMLNSIQRPLFLPAGSQDSRRLC